MRGETAWAQSWGGGGGREFGGETNHGKNVRKVDTGTECSQRSPSTPQNNVLYI